MKGVNMLTLLMVTLTALADEAPLRTDYEIQRDLAAERWHQYPKGDHWVYYKGIQSYCSINYMGDDTPKGQVKFFVSCIYDNEKDCEEQDTEENGCKTRKEAFTLIRK
jgi:hypothetical protein